MADGRGIGSAAAVSLVMLLSAAAEAGPTVRIRMRLSPVENDAQLVGLLRVNTRRVYQQRQRLWEEAEKREAERKLQARHRHRVGHRMGTASGTGTAAGIGMPATDVRAGKAATGTASRLGVAPGSEDKGVVNIGKILRRNRLRNQARLDKNLTQKQREARSKLQQIKRNRHQWRHRDTGMKGRRSGAGRR
ncbi:MAG: hypothetical protein J7M25_17955 [Deltaproteobacteria bacterium]|nr:hypothetical protein [Deltaproteobacteria bacterium]